MIRNQRQAFNDGVVRIYAVGNGALPGRTPVKALKDLKAILRYEERTVGVTRYWGAKKYDVQIDLVLRCAAQRAITVGDVAVLPNSRQYMIKQVQYPKDAGVPVMDLSLERLGEGYAYV